MKYIFIFISILASPCWAATCGLYQVKDFGDRTLYSLTEFKDQHGTQIHYTIQNPGVEIVRSMVRGLCYCVDGLINQDPEFEGDDSFRLISIRAIVLGPFQGCTPLARSW